MPPSSFQPAPFYRQIRDEYEQFLNRAAAGFDPVQSLRIDLHCHDHNSDVPDELWGRLLNLPETWLKTDELVSALQRSAVDVITVTNHNNARSCWTLQESRREVLSGAEFTCHFPGDELSVHVLTYGFDPQQESELATLRHDIYAFCAYARQHNLPTVLPHPLFFYSHGKPVQPDVLERFAVLFERFEVLNGQRGYWQNLLTLRWVESLTPERIDRYARKHGLDPLEFCREPYRKRLTGGSDDHNGLFAGQCGTLLEVPNLQARLEQGASRAELALEALREGRIAPYGCVGEEEKLTTTFLDYFAQVVLHIEDPGLLRLFLHKGDLKDKLICLGLSNLLQELKRHRYTLGFLKTFHNALKGKKPKLLLNLGVSREFKPTLKLIKRIARTQRKEPERLPEVLREAIPALHHQISDLFFRRVHDHLQRIDHRTLGQLPLDELVRLCELPTYFRALSNGGRSGTREMSQVDIGRVLDKLTFPALAAGVLAGAAFASTRVLYANRGFLNQLAQQLDTVQHPQRVLWLTDTFSDRNGVSSVLQDLLIEVQRQDLPIDLLVCHPTLEPAPHLHVLRPVTEFSFSQLGEQTVYLPNMLEVQRLFEHGSYDRIVCSTELCMGAIALYLKHAYSVPTWFYMHTDWLEYINRTTRLSPQAQDRLRRLMRGLYQQFDGLFVLNEEHRDWLVGPAMELPEVRVRRTAHWCSPRLNLVPSERLADAAPVLLYVGRLSEEKGVLDLAYVWRQVRDSLPDARLRIAGSGPAEARLRAELPEAEFLGWVAPKALGEVYGGADLLLLPSRFDTFGCVILEAMCCGVPTLAYNCKGPATVIETEVSGLLADDLNEMAEAAVRYLSDPDWQTRMRQQALQRSRVYQAEGILTRLLEDLGVVESGGPDTRRAGLALEQLRTDLGPDAA